MLLLMIGMLTARWDCVLLSNPSRSWNHQTSMDTGPRHFAKQALSQSGIAGLVSLTCKKFALYICWSQPIFIIDSLLYSFTEGPLNTAAPVEYIANGLSRFDEYK